MDPAALTVALLTALPFVALYWLVRFWVRRRIGAVLRAPRPWQRPTLEGWAARGWLDPEFLSCLPQQLTPATVLYEWSWADPAVARAWRMREELRADTPIEAVVTDLWVSLPAPLQAASRECLAAELARSCEWWGGAERGWNRRPLALRTDDLPRKQAALPLLPLTDLTCAPGPGAFRPAMAEEADGPDLLLALTATRRGSWTFAHPLAPRQGDSASMIQGLSTQVGTDVGRRVGAGLGAVLGPIGSMVGQYLGGMAGALGGQAVARQMLPEQIQGTLAETEKALGYLGELAMSAEFTHAAAQPAAAVLEFGKRQEAVREDRARRVRQRLWPTVDQAAVEETLRVALVELSAYRAAGEYFAGVARRAPEAVAGGMILQNPWLARFLKDGPERITRARQALNRSAVAIRRASAEGRSK